MACTTIDITIVFWFNSLKMRTVAVDQNFEGCIRMYIIKQGI